MMEQKRLTYYLFLAIVSCLYNLYTNNLLVNYSWSFSIPPAKVPMIHGKHCFSVRKSVFDDPIDYLLGRAESTDFSPKEQ